MKWLIPLKLSMVLSNVMIAPPLQAAELLMKLLVPLNLSTVLSDVEIAPPCTTSNDLLNC